ncbi:protein vreteno [Drosophila grimshawi]|uniref:GH18662 n=1 Tax=Drosophila grimshawi TaxID=7222 RepID=B4JH46_DROGR|nr:protein vreteno [Drosophila grimshawi]EDV92737.1 GH18662 [Drosophila grimshawi]
MAEQDNCWPDWDPMAQHYNDESCNKYDSVNEGAHRSNRQINFPYLIIKKMNAFITDKLLRNFFGETIIYDIEFRSASREFFVYFHNIGCVEAAWTKIRQFPNYVHCVKRQPRQSQSELPNLLHQTAETALAVSEPNAIDLISRIIQLSTGNKAHPQFFKSPLVIKADYTARNSLLAVNDPSRRYLNVKYEFALERLSQDIVEKDQAVFHFRCGRLIVTPQHQLEPESAVGESKLALQIVQKCLVCDCYTDNSCRFCQMPFCNPVCFDALAAAHKQSCAKGISPPIIDNTNDKMLSKPKLPPSGSHVKITAFEQNNVLYVRSAKVKDEVAYYKLISDVMMSGKAASPLRKLPQCGQLVIYKFDKQIVRAMVLNVDNPQAICLVSVDYGSVEITTLETLYECSAYLASLPRHAVPVLLRGVPRRYMGPNVRHMLYELDETYTFVLKYSQREFDFEMGMQRVILIESEMNRSLNRLLKTIVSPVEPSLSDPGYEENYLQHVHLPTGHGIDLVIMDNTFIKFGVIHCTTLDFAYEVTQMQRDIQFYGESIAKCAYYAPPKNDLCIAKYQGKWCRGLCMELVGDGYPSILFIDYGNIVPVHVDDIRPYPPQFTFAILTTEYELIGLPAEPSDELLTGLEKHLAIGSIVNCDEVMYNELDNNYSLRISAVHALMK